MIVSRRPEGLVLVRQVDHQLQCAAMAEAWGDAVFGRPEPYGPVVEAARIHDEGWRAWEEAPEVGADGAPVDFPHLDRGVHVRLYRESIRRAEEADPRAGLLVSMHGQGLYEARRGLDAGSVTPRELREPAVREFLDEQDAVQARLARGAEGVGDVGAWSWAGYRLLQAWDVLSLYLTWWPLPSGRRMTLPQVPREVGDAGLDLDLRPAGPLTCICEPWPFSGDEVALPVAARTIPDRPYASSEDLREALDAAEWMTLGFTVRRP